MPISLFIQQCGFHKEWYGGKIYCNRLTGIRMKKKSIDYYRPQVVVIFSLWKKSNHARGLLNRFWQTISSSSLIQRYVGLDTWMTMLKMCASLSIKNKQRKNSYTADSNSSNINLPKQRILLTLYCDITDEIYHKSFTIR